MKKTVAVILKETLIQMLISVILVTVAAFVVLKVSPSDTTVKIMIFVIYGIAAFTGGFILGKAMNRRKFLWGMAAGAIYIAILLLISLIVKGSLGTGTVDMLTGIIVSLVAGTIGGMLG
jgi:putative membrane protein (TIGR04086 family)